MFLEKLKFLTPLSFLGLALCMPALQAASDFTISVSPTVRTVKRGSGTLYDIRVDSIDGFEGKVQFQVSGLPPASVVDFPPLPVTGHGTSGFTVQTHKVTTPQGTFTLTVTGASGGLSHSAQVTLVTR